MRVDTKAFTRTLPDSDVVVRGIEYNMEDFLRSSVERYKELTGVTVLSRTYAIH